MMMRNLVFAVLIVTAIAFGIQNVQAMGEHTEKAQAAPKAAPEEIAAPEINEELQALITPRILGNPDAPIRIEEFASLSCGHCADFHTKTLPSIKEHYIDTGKAYLVYNDFPLNQPALFGSMTARCVPESRYFDFLKLLFEKQEDWAFKPNFQQILGQYASLLGLGKDAFESCLANQDLQEGLIANVKTAQEKWKISSTPSFVINNKEVITGARNFDAFKEKFDAISGSQTAE